MPIKSHTFSNVEFSYFAFANTAAVNSLSPTYEIYLVATSPSFFNAFSKALSTQSNANLLKRSVSPQ